jgi:hypothetical protein
MKKILLLAMAAATLATTTSCSDFLEEKNKTAQTADLAYSSETGVSGLVNSCYSFARGWWGKEAGLGLSEMGTDDFYYGFDNKQKSLVSYNFTAQSLDNNAADNPCLDQYWELFYAAVDVCNNALVYINKNTEISETTRQQYLGEVKFLRALYYSQMVALWGPIPYNTDPITATSTTPVRVPEKEVYANILKDIEESITHFTTAKYTDKTADGRATLYAAYALKARVALYAASWLGNSSVSGYSNLYQTAQEAAQKVIDESKATFYDRYSDVWNLNNEAIKDNKEAIWGISYDNEFTTASGVPQRYKTDNDGNYQNYVNLITRVNDRGGSAMSLMFVSLWNNGNSGDIGKSGSSNKSIFVRCTGGTSNYITSALTGKSVEVAPYYSPYGRGFTRYLPSLYLWKTLDGIKSTDQRADGTLLTHYNVVDGLQKNVKSTYPNMGEHMTATATAYAADGNYFNAGDTAIYYSALNGDSEEGKALQAYAKGRYRLQFAAGGDIPVFTSDDPATAIPTSTKKAKSDVYGDTRYNDDKIGGLRSYPGIKKFLDDQYNASYPTNDLSYRDFIVFRLSEMYLIKAECQMQNGGDALATLNELRTARAIDGKEEANKLKGTVDINTILNERAIELCGEFQRWFDLKRTHTLLDRVKAYNAQASSNIALKYYYRPIPQVQMDACTNVVATSATQDANGVLKYESQTDGFWQNPGF